MPTPKPGKESKDEWMSRCVPVVMNEGKPQDQAVAQCSGMWEQAGGKQMNAPVVKLTRTNERAYSILTVKDISEEQKMITGMATTPTPDRMGDIVEPEGVGFKNPMPLLWQHRSGEPVGWVKFGKATPDGIPFEAKLASPTISENLIKRVAEAWESVKLGLVRGVSIGFRALEYSFLDDGGIHFLKTEVYELSLVTIPANAEATINTIKQFDMDARSKALHDKTMAVARQLEQPLTGIGDKQDLSFGAKFKTAMQAALGQDGPEKIIPATRITVSKPEKPKMPKTVAEQISAFETKRAASAAAMSTIMEKAAEEGSTLDQAESDEYDRLEKEVADIDLHLVRLRKLEQQQKQQLTLVDPKEEVRKTANPALKQPVTIPARSVSVKANCPDWVPFIRYAMCIAAGNGDTMKSLQRAEAYRDSNPELADMIKMNIPEMLRENPNILKAAVGMGTTTDATWASPLVTYTQYAEAFAAVLRPLTIIGRIPGIRTVPFNISIPVATQGSTVAWVGENAPKPVGNMAFAQILFRWAKAAGIIVLSQELVRFSNPAAESIVRDDLMRQMIQFLDRQFVDPSVAAVTNVSPASITNSATPVTATGTNDAAFRTDARGLINTFFTNNYQLGDAVWIGTQQQATAFSLMLNALGQQSYPTMSPTGGTLLGFPFVASENIPATGGSPADGYPLILAAASDIMVADDGQTLIDASNQASIQMDSAPDSPPSASTVLVSLWQMNAVGLRAERWINWGKRRTTCVQYIQNAKYA